MVLQVDFEERVDEATGKKVATAILEDGRRFDGDLLIGADGIWSKVLLAGRGAFGSRGGRRLPFRPFVDHRSLLRCLVGAS
jgi:2-polyprenyl-6-methoxyphenol hydroxylase-like FAD-dependent oxidoreductase